MALLMSTELASSAAAAALNSPSRPLSAALVASAASCTCSPSSWSRAERSAAALVLADGLAATCVIVLWSALASGPVSAKAETARAKTPIRVMETMLSLLSIPGHDGLCGPSVEHRCGSPGSRSLQVDDGLADLLECGRRVVLLRLLRGESGHG